MTITSAAFKLSDKIPPQYTCDGEDINPPLAFSEVPEGAKSLALIMDDPDAPNSTFTHWVIYDMSPLTLQIPENSTPITGKMGINDFAHKGYGGPCPPTGTHHYHFKLYALDIETGLPDGASDEELMIAMDGHILESAELISEYQRR
jgi:hypothetical protein